LGQSRTQSHRWLWVRDCIWAESGGFSRAHYKLVQDLQISQGYIFLILQHFATKLRNLTNLNMLFPAVMMDFVLLA
jgi:hypothetical protein